jgi:hypothetical protein
MAKRVSCICFSLLLVAALAASVAAEQAMVDIVRQIKPAVVTVITYDKRGAKDSQGSGFFVDASHVVTDWHVIEDASRVVVRAADSKTYPVKGIDGGGETSDLALLELSSPVAGAKALTVVSSVPEPGERVIVVGSPYGLDATVSDGIVSAVRELPSLGKVIQISAPISRGSSGSPVVNMSGQVIGVAQAIHGDGQNLNFAIPGARVLAMSGGGGTGRHFALAPRSETPTPSDQGAGPAISAEDSFQRGYGLFRSKSYEAALPFLLQATRANPQHYFAWFAVGHCYVQMERYAEAVDAFKHVIKIKPDFIEGQCSLGAALGLNGQHDDAVKVFKTAIQLDPSSSIAHYGLGLEYLGSGDQTNAMQEYKTLQKLDPTMAGKLMRVIRG